MRTSGPVENSSAPKQSAPPAITIARSVFSDIRSTIGVLPAETGGMLGGPVGTRVVTHFYFDGTAGQTTATYCPDTAQLGQVLSRWLDEGIELLGFIHSHPPGVVRPSQGDLVYAQRILAANGNLRQLLLPIVVSAADSAFDIHTYVARRTRARVAIDDARLEICEDKPSATGMFKHLSTFARVVDAYDLDRLEDSRVIAVGCGGAASFLEDLTRGGVGEFVLIDPDTVSETNLATQQVYRSALGRPKVAALAERLRDINPFAFVVACAESLNDLSDVEVCYLARTPFRTRPASHVLLCGMTDDFHAQARINRLALQLRLPSLCAQVYAQGLGAEVTFTHPEVTAACHRCMLRSRYQAFLEERFVNAVGSAGSPLYATVRLNALKQFVALALLHHGSAHRRWGPMLGRIGQRNLIQLRLDPDLTLPGVKAAFDTSDPVRLFCDDAVWLPQDQWLGCPDCQPQKKTAIDASAAGAVLRPWPRV